MLFYFEGPEAPKAKGRVLIDNPGVLDLTRERDGEFVRQIIPDHAPSADAEPAEGGEGPDAAEPSLTALLSQHCKHPPEARALTLRWPDYSAMEEWSAAFDGHFLEEPPSPPDAADQPAAAEQKEGEKESAEDDEDAAARVEAEKVRERLRSEQEDRDVLAMAEQALAVPRGEHHEH